MSESAADTQCALILRHLKKGLTITPMEALKYFDCLRLAPRILELRRAGHQIDRQMIHNPFSGKRYAEYRLAKRRAA